MNDFPVGYQFVNIVGNEFPIPTLEHLEEQHRTDEARKRILKNMEVNDREPYHLKFTNLQLIEPVNETVDTDGAVFEYHEWQEKYSGRNDNSKEMDLAHASGSTLDDFRNEWSMFIEQSFKYAKNGGQKLLDELVNKRRKTYLHIGTTEGDIFYTISSRLKVEKVDFTKYYDWVMKRCNEKMEHGGSLIGSGHLYELVMADKYIEEA